MKKIYRNKNKLPGTDKKVFYVLFLHDDGTYMFKVYKRGPKNPVMYESERIKLSEFEALLQAESKTVEINEEISQGRFDFSKTPWAIQKNKKNKDGFAD